MKGLAIRKVATLLLAANMLSGLLLPAVGSINVYADTNTTSAPSITAYASKSDLKDKFAPDSGNIGKLKFGKNSNSKVQEWYILGSDSGVDDDNTAIFAASNMILAQVFNADYRSEKSYEASMGAYKNKPEKVLPNHYGASDIRKVLRQISGEDSGASENYKNLLSDAEKKLLNPTTVRTDDFRDSSKDTYLDIPNYYTTSDKLYLPAWDYRGQKTNKPTKNKADFEYVYIGSESDRKTPSDAQRNSSGSSLIWLRSPLSTHYSYSLCANLGVCVAYSSIEVNHGLENLGVRPASNLNLSSVLFASAAAVASSDASEAGSITAGEAMTLRLDGKDQNIGSVKATTDAITVTKGSTDKDIVLVVQGKVKVNDNDETDWYYSKAITEEKKINKTDIESKLSNIISSASIDLSSCKIWLEIIGDDGMLYAVDASFEPTHTHIYDGTWTSNETDHWHQCTSDACPDIDDSIKDKDEHTFNDEEICTVCGYDASNGFTYHPERKATCKATGNEEYWEYKVGDKTTYYQARSAERFGIQGARELATVSNAPIFPEDPDNHEYFDEQSDEYKPYAKEYVKVDASTHKILCSGCEAEIGTASHNFSGNKCVDCGYTKSSNSSGGSGGSSNTSTGWIKDSKGWKYRNSDGIIAQGSTVTDKDGNKVEKVLWQKAGNGYYAFGSDGYLVTGWIYDKLDDKWYYCDENNGKLYGWFNEAQDGYWYYLSPSTGEAMTGWQNINGKDYYLSGEPSAPTYSFDASTGFWIYSNIYSLRPFGSMYANTVTPDNYQVDANGAWIH